MSSLYKDSALSQIGLELQTWLWMLLRKIRASDTDAGNEGLVSHTSPHAVLVPLERLGLSPSGAAAAALAFTGASTAGSAGLTADSRMPTCGGRTSDIKSRRHPGPSSLRKRDADEHRLFCPSSSRSDLWLRLLPCSDALA